MPQTVSALSPLSRGLMHGVGEGAGELKFEGTKMGGPTRQYMIDTAKTQKIATPTNAYFLFITLASLYCELLRKTIENTRVMSGLYHRF